MTCQFYKSIEDPGDPENDVCNWISVEKEELLNMHFSGSYPAAKWDGVRDGGGNIRRRWAADKCEWISSK